MGEEHAIKVNKKARMINEYDFILSCFSYDKNKEKTLFFAFEQRIVTIV